MPLPFQKKEMKMHFLNPFRDFSPDVVFIAVKTQDVENTCRRIKPFIGSIPIVMMQNGVVSSEIAGSILGKENIVSCTLLLNAQFQKPGVATYVNQNSIVVGEPFTQNGPRTKQIQTLLGKVAETKISDNILGIQWSKLFINAMGNALDGMTGLPLGVYIKHKALRIIAISILQEAFHVVERAGIRLEPLPGIPLAFFKLLIALPTPIAAGVLKYAMTFKGDKNIITSTLQSLRKGKKTEIDFLNGEFVRLGNQTGFPTPVNAKVVELIHEIERGGLFYAPEELANIFDNLRSPWTEKERATR